MKTETSKWFKDDAEKVKDFNFNVIKPKDREKLIKVELIDEKRGGRLFNYVNRKGGRSIEQAKHELVDAYLAKLTYDFALHEG